METATILQAQNHYATYSADNAGSTATDNFPEQVVNGIFEANTANVTETFGGTETDAQENWEQSSQWWGRCVRYGDWKWT